MPRGSAPELHCRGPTRPGDKVDHRAFSDVIAFLPHEFSMSMRSATFLATQLIGGAVQHRQGAIVVVAGEHKAELLARLLDAMLPDRVCRFLPAWDCLPYDRASPSAEMMGLRMRAIRDVAAAQGRAVVITTPDAALQRLPPVEAAGTTVAIEAGDTLEQAVLEPVLLRMGYVPAEAVDEVGGFAFHGQVVDIFPPGEAPCRITLDGAEVADLHHYDPLTQRRHRAELPKVEIGPVSELVAAEGEVLGRGLGAEHWLSTAYPALGSLLTLMPKAKITIEEPACPLIDSLFDQIQDAYEARLRIDRPRETEGARAPLAPDRLYLTRDEWRKGTGRRLVSFPDGQPSGPVASFFLESKVGRAFRAFLRTEHDAGRRLVLAAAGQRSLAAMVKQAGHAVSGEVTSVKGWSEVVSAPAGAVLAMRLPADHGFVDEPSGITLVTAGDLLGSRVTGAHHAPGRLPWHGLDGEFAFDDAVVHLDHGMGVLRSLETVGEAGALETARFDYAGGADLLSPVDDLSRVWRYSGGQDVALDRLHGEGWAKRRGRILADIGETARELVSIAMRKADAPAPKLVPPPAEFERFCGGFPYPLTPDQGRAISDVLTDLASGRAMDRLVIGDVGFGKTEVALRAAAAAVLAGRQVAVVAPTTVLARQHVQTFRKRFEAIGIEAAQLSRLVADGEAHEVKEGLADGRIRLVVGTHALMGKGIAFADLGLLVVDEEQRFGAADKAKLRALGEAVHSLTLSATPIPRTLQMALVGLQAMSVIATAPARRRPIRTLLAPFDLATVRTALMHEHARGGQSFVVVPRIADLERFAHELGQIVPDLALVMAHGALDGDVVDEVMVAFADGRGGDVLLATSIIESGLDVPRANTMIVLDAGRFGLAQLHQLRGRVGRGRQQGICYLMTDAETPLPETTRRRLASLAAHDRLGSGMAISAADLDARGAGDLTGDSQAGHLKLIGVGLYQHLLGRAVRQARGEVVEDWTPAIHEDEQAGHIPESYIAEPIIRLNTYARLARGVDVDDLDDLEAELEDRFGPPPPEMVQLVARARLRILCHSHAIERVDIGPKAVAFSLRPNVAADDLTGHLPAAERQKLIVKDGRLIYPHQLDDSQARFELAARLLGDMH